MLRTSDRAGRLLWAALSMVLGVTLIPAVAPATVVDIYPTACGPSDAWLCYGFGATEDPILWTTFEEPEFEITLNPHLPDDPENWRTINVHAGTMESVGYAFYYPSPEYAGSAQLAELSFMDSSGTKFFSTARGLVPTCFETSSGFMCADGDSLVEGKEFGEVDWNPHWGAPDPSFVPDMFGTSRIRVAWYVAGDEPTSSTLRVNHVGFGFVLAPIPEPSTAALLGFGLSMLRLLQHPLRNGDRLRA